MDSKDYFEKVMQDYNWHHHVRSFHKYCKDGAVGHDWLIELKKTCPSRITDAHYDINGRVLYSK